VIGSLNRCLQAARNKARYDRPMQTPDHRAPRRLFILPGLDGSGFGLEAFCDALNTEFNVTVLRLPDTESDYQRLSDWAIAEIGKTPSFYLLGESFSGPLAIKVAARLGERLCGLILCATFAHAPVHAGAWLRRVLPLMPPIMPPHRVLSAVLFGDDSTDKWRSEFAATMRALDVRVAKARVSQALAVDVRKELLQAQARVLVLQSSRDRLLRANAFADLTATQRNVTIENIDGAHFLLQTRADECARAVRSHFQNPR
jgi:pimeloyl-[acyl-carrier protein] methyl ester esterase